MAERKWTERIGKNKFTLPVFDAEILRSWTRRQDLVTKPDDFNIPWEIGTLYLKRFPELSLLRPEELQNLFSRSVSDRCDHDPNFKTAILNELVAVTGLVERPPEELDSQ